MCDEAGLRELISSRGVTHVASMAAQAGGASRPPTAPPPPLQSGPGLPQAGVRYSLSNPQSYIRSNLQCFVSLLEAPPPAPPSPAPPFPPLPPAPTALPPPLCAPSAAGSARLAPRAAHLRLLLLRLRSKHEAALLRVGPRQQELARNPHGTFLQAALLRVGPRRRAQLAVRRHQARKRGQPNPNPSPTPTRCTPPPSAQTRLARPTRLRPSRRLREPEPSRRMTGARPGCRRSPTSTTGCTGCA